MAVTVSVTTRELMQELTAEVYGIAVQVREPARGVLPLADATAAGVGAALKQQLMDRVSAPGGAASGGRFFVAVGDAFLASESFDDDDVAVRLEVVAQRAGRMLSSQGGDGIRDDGIVLLKHLAVDPECSADSGRAALFDLHDSSDEQSYVEFILPVVLAGSPRTLFEIASDFVQASFPARSLVYRAVASALEPHRPQSMAPCTRLDVLRSDEASGGDGDEVDPQACVPSSDEWAFLETAARHAGGGVEEIVELAQLPSRVLSLQQDALSSGRPRLAHSQDVALVVTAETVYVGFKTIDELGTNALERASPPPCDGMQLGKLWSRWFMQHYMVLVATLLQSRFKVLAFPLFDWGRRLAESDAGSPFDAGKGALRALEPLHIEASTHDLTHGAQGTRVLCRLMLEEPAPAATATDVVDLETTPVLCSVVRVVDERGRGVSQNNLYLTIPSPTIRHHEYAGSLAQFQGLPVEAGIHELVVCDQCLKLIVPAGDEGTASPDDERDPAVPLRYIAPPRQGRLH